MLYTFIFIYFFRLNYHSIPTNFDLKLGGLLGSENISTAIVSWRARIYLFKETATLPIQYRKLKVMSFLVTGKFKFKAYDELAS